MAEPPKPPLDEDKPRSSFTDDDRDIPLPHEDRSWITGKKRESTWLEFGPDSPPSQSPKPEERSENKPHSAWSSEEYRRIKAEREAKLPPSERGQSGWEKAAEKMARDHAMVSNVFKQITEPPKTIKHSTGSTDGGTETGQPNMEKFGSLKLDILLAVILFLVPLGWSVSGFPPNIILACICWGLTLVLVLHVFWIWERTGRLPPWLKITVTLLVPIVLIAGAWQPVKDEYRKEHPITELSPSTATTQSQEDLRAALRADSFKSIRDVGFHIKLNRKYSIAELGHFRVIFEIFDNEALDWFMACQDLYGPTYDVKSNPYGLRTNGYGGRCTVRYRTSQKADSFTAIAAYGTRKYSAFLTGDPSVDVMEWQIDLYKQLPSYKTLEDLNRKLLYIFVTESLADKISEISFDVNNWELASAKSSRLMFPEDRPIAKWFLPLSNSEKSIKWRGVYLREPEEFSKRYPGLSGRPWVWPLDFALLSPRKLPEPDIKIDALK